MKYIPFKTSLSNFLYQFFDTISTIRQMILKIITIFFVWFSTVFGIGIALLMILKIAFILFPESHTLLPTIGLLK